MRITIDILCGSCEHRWDEMLERSEIEGLIRVCPECGGEAKRTMSAPAIKKVSYHDGYRRGDKYQIMKEVAKLKTDRASMHHDKRNDVSQEIRNLQRVASTKKDKSE